MYASVLNKCPISIILEALKSKANDGLSKLSRKQRLSNTKFSTLKVEVAYECDLTSYIKNKCEGKLVSNLSLFDNRYQW